MYRPSQAERRLLSERANQFREQTERYRKGELSADQFRPLRLLNGVYEEKHNPLLRIAVPYGQLSSAQLRLLARIARVYDRGYGHFTTRHNFQLNWVRLDQVPEILAELAQYGMHAIQSCGNSIRGLTTDLLAGVSPNEVADPRPWAEIFRQWATLHPEFSFLPRKFKVAVTGDPSDPAGVRFHDLGFELRHEGGRLGFRVWVGGGLGRTPRVGRLLREFLPWPDFLSYSEAVLRVYNLRGRRDHPYKSRIKILVDSLGIEAFRHLVENEWQHGRGGPLTLNEKQVEAVSRHFAPAAYELLPRRDSRCEFLCRFDKEFARWASANLLPHRQQGYVAVSIPLKAPGRPSGDIESDQLDAVADLAERYAYGEVRSSQRQDLILPDVRRADLYNLWQELRRVGLATPVGNTPLDLVSCPGADLCSLAYARTQPVTFALQSLLAEEVKATELGPLRINVSGCMNACGHHHVGDIGLLGLEKSGDEHFQLVLGGRFDAAARMGKVVGPAFPVAEAANAVVRVIAHFRRIRLPGECFSDALARLGCQTFVRAAYGQEDIDIHQWKEVANG